jgi:hypothetical protein
MGGGSRRLLTSFHSRSSRPLRPGERAKFFDRLLSVMKSPSWTLRLVGLALILCLGLILRSDLPVVALACAIVFSTPPLPSNLDWIRRPDSADILALLQSEVKPTFAPTRRWWLISFELVFLALAILVVLTITRNLLTAHVPRLLPTLRQGIMISLLFGGIGYSIGMCITLYLYRVLRRKSRL